MIQAIEVEDYATGRTVQLDAEQVRQVRRELRRTKANQKRGGPPPLVGPDLKLICDHGTRRTEYELFGRMVLINVDKGRARQFYMGLLILEWLDRNP